MLLIALCVRAHLKGARTLHTAARRARGRLFWIYKFRSMETRQLEKSGPGLTRDGDTVSRALDAGCAN